MEHNSYRSRQATNKLIEMMEQGIIEPKTLAIACMCYMSESDVADMANINEYFVVDEVDDAAFEEVYWKEADYEAV